MKEKKRKEKKRKEITIINKINQLFQTQQQKF